MARTQGTNARTQRLTALLATALLATATAFAIGRVFVDHASTYRMALAGLLSAAIAVALERRGLFLAALVSAAAMVAVVGFMVFPDTTWPHSTWFGLPTLETVRAMVEAAGMVGEQARVQVAPTEPLAPLMLAALTATWAAIFSAHALAFRAGSPILALLPPIALVAFADTVLEDVVRPLYGVAFLIAATAMIFADGLRRVQGWGPVWTGPGREARLSLTAGRGARRVALAAVGFAAISPLLVPGFGSTAVIDFSSSGEQVRLNPLVSVGARLQRDDPLPVFEVTSERPTYWRMVALPDFDGTTWNPDTQPQVQDLVEGASLTVNAPADPSIPVEPLTASFRTTGDLDLPWLPAPYPASTTNIDADGLAWDPEAGAITLDGTVDTGTSYSITSQSVVPTAEELRAQPPVDAASLARYLAYPDSLPLEIENLARSWTADAETNTYDQVMAIQDRFTDGKEFIYDDTVAPRDDEDALLDFLTLSKAGFCQQFSSSMAVMLRTLGIPARVVVGFTAGSFDDEDRLRRVTTDQAHAWVEVFFPDYGWLTFDPTPGRTDVLAYPYLDASVRSGCQGGPRCVNPNGPGAPDVTGEPIPGQLTPGLLERKEGTFGDRALPTLPDAQDAGAIDDPPAISPRTWLGLGALLLVLVLALIPPARELGRRRRLRQAAREPRTLILTTYDVFTERAGELGFARAPGQTMQEYRDGVRANGGLSDDGPEMSELGALTTLTTEAAYAPREPGASEASEASRAAATTLKGLRREVGWVRRITGAYHRT